MNKKVTTSQIRKAVQLAKTYSIEVTLSCILGFPNETYSDVQKTIDFMISLEGDRYLFNFLMIYPGTEIERRQKELNIKPIADDTWGRVAKTPFEIPTVETENLSVKDLSRLYIEARLKLEGLVESREVESSPI